MSTSLRPADRTKLGRPRPPLPGLQDGLCLGDPGRPRLPAGQRPTRDVWEGLFALGDAGVRWPPPTPRSDGGGSVRARGPCGATACGRTPQPGARAPAARSSSARCRVYSPRAQRCDRETMKGRSPPGRSCPRSFPRQEVLFSVKLLSRPSLLVPAPSRSTPIAFFPPLHLCAWGSLGPGRVGSRSPVAALERRPENSFQPHLSLSLLGRTSLP